MKTRTIMATASRRRGLLARTVGVAALGALSWVVLTAGASGPSDRDALVADEAPGYAVEDFNYPGADKILEDQGIVLKRGDGHITLADCASETDLLEVSARRNADNICFRVVGDSGWLTLEVPAVYLIKGNSYDTQVDMTVGTEKKSFDIDKNAWTAVGETADEQGREHMLVEIRTSK